MRYLFAVGLILCVATLGWLILGVTLMARTESSDESQRALLSGIWGSPLDQHPAQILLLPGRGTSRLSPERTAIAVDLALDRRQKGLLWYDTYAVTFDATYVLRGGDRPMSARIWLPLSTKGTTYQDVSVQADGADVPYTASGDALLTYVRLPADEPVTVHITYRSHGLDTWRYTFGDAADVRNFTLVMTTNFRDVDFPSSTLAPTSEEDTPLGRRLTWSFGNLIAGNGIGMDFPEAMQPGPLAQRITFWAPLALGFYFFVLVIYTTLRKIDLHPMNYFFLAGAFYAFHLLFAYTVDRLPIGVAFALSSVVSMFLTISYLRLVVGLRFAAVEAAAAQFFYLILFSLALFNEGFSGLSITVGAIVTLFVTMQWTARTDWNVAFARGGQAKAA